MHHSDDSNRLFVARLREQLQQRQVTAEPAPTRDGIEVQEISSMIHLSEEDQRLLMSLQERHKMYKERTETLPSLGIDLEDTAYDTVRVKQIIVPEA